MWKNGQFRNWTRTNGWPHQRVMSIVRTRPEEFWLGTEAGLIRFDGKSTTLNVTELAGFPALPVSCIASADADSLWFGAYPRGLWRYTPGAGLTNPASFTSWTTNNGLIDNNAKALAPRPAVFSGSAPATG